MKINKEYLDSIKQDLVDTVARTKFIVPEIFLSITDMPHPDVNPDNHENKSKLRLQRRKDISAIWNDYPDDAVRLIRNYHEKELLTFLNEFSQFKEGMFL